MINIDGFGIKTVVSFFAVLFSLLALHDILKGRENVLDEVIVLFLTGVWFLHLVRPFKPNQFFPFLLLSLSSLVLHNVISHLFKFEDGFFFVLTFLFFGLSLIYFIKFILKSYVSLKRS